MLPVSSSATSEVFPTNSSDDPTVQTHMNFFWISSHSLISVGQKEILLLSLYLHGPFRPMLEHELWYHTVTSPTLRPAKRTLLHAKKSGHLAPWTCTFIWNAETECFELEHAYMIIYHTLEANIRSYKHSTCSSHSLIVNRIAEVK